MLSDLIRTLTTIYIYYSSFLAPKSVRSHFFWSYPEAKYFYYSSLLSQSHHFLQVTSGMQSFYKINAHQKETPVIWLAISTKPKAILKEPDTLYMFHISAELLGDWAQSDRFLQLFRGLLRKYHGVCYLDTSCHYTLPTDWPNENGIPF